MNEFRFRIASRHALAMLPLLFCLVSPISAHQGDDNQNNAAIELSESQQTIIAVLENYANAYAAADVDGIAALTVADETFSYFEGSSADWGWADHAAHLETEFPAFSEGVYRFTNIRPVVDDQLAYATFAWTLDVVILSDQFEGGRHPVNMQGLATAVLIKKGSNWRLKHLATARKTES